MHCNAYQHKLWNRQRKVKAGFQQKTAHLHVHTTISAPEKRRCFDPIWECILDTSFSIGIWLSDHDNRGRWIEQAVYPRNIQGKG